jgi:hypothetical protein
MLLYLFLIAPIFCTLQNAALLTKRDGAWTQSQQCLLLFQSMWQHKASVAIQCPFYCVPAWLLSWELHCIEILRAENSGSNFNPQFNKCSNSWWIQSYYMINVPSSERQ